MTAPSVSDDRDRIMRHHGPLRRRGDKKSACLRALRLGSCDPVFELRMTR